MLAGPDGVGKTSLRLALAEDLSSEFSVLSDRGAGPLVSARAVSPDRWARMTYLGQRSQLGSEFKVVYLYLDRVLHAIKVERPWLDAGNWIITERGWWDLAVFPARYRLRANSLMHRLLSRFVLRPDLILVLEANAEVVFSRKQERSIPELERQMEKWRSVIPTYQPHSVLNASVSQEAVVEQAKSVIQSMLGVSIGGDGASTS